MPAVRFRLRIRIGIRFRFSFRFFGTAVMACRVRGYGCSLTPIYEGEVNAPWMSDEPWGQDDLTPPSHTPNLTPPRIRIGFQLVPYQEIVIRLDFSSHCFLSCLQDFGRRKKKSERRLLQKSQNPRSRLVPIYSLQGFIVSFLLESIQWMSQLERENDLYGILELTHERFMARCTVLDEVLFVIRMQRSMGTTSGDKSVGGCNCRVVYSWLADRKREGWDGSGKFHSHRLRADRALDLILLTLKEKIQRSSLRKFT